VRRVIDQGDTIARKSIASRRFGIAEWFGTLFHLLTSEQRRGLALELLSKDARARTHDCPFKGGTCTKSGGVCSIRLYEKSADGKVRFVEGTEGRIRSLCPHRFGELNTIVTSIGKELLGTDSPLIVREVGFLKPLPTIGGRASEGDADAARIMREIGKIDLILVHPSHEARLDWCAVEVQAVYFSGDKMEREFEGLSSSVDTLPFPFGRRRPDYRSSGPKRLMPQLQLKVRDITRWGKRMAVVIDRSFFDSLSEMRFEKDKSNADIAWFVVDFVEGSFEDRRAHVRLDSVFYTRLEDAVAGLTGGVALTQSEFEIGIRRKLASKHW